MRWNLPLQVRCTPLFSRLYRHSNATILKPSLDEVMNEGFETNHAKDMYAELLLDHEEFVKKSLPDDTRIVHIRFGHVLSVGGSFHYSKLPCLARITWSWPVILERYANKHCVGLLGSMKRDMFGNKFWGRIGGGAQWLPWIHVDDAAMMCRFAIENEKIVGVRRSKIPSYR
jgi:NAD dependent epimerase/dehydratase family enzyme